jgi:hypothetical protein
MIPLDVCVSLTHCSPAKVKKEGVSVMGLLAGVGENMRFHWQLICYNAVVGSKDFEKGEKP